jgi:hypothetical protein
MQLAESKWLPCQKAQRRVYNSVNIVRSAQRVENVIGTRENVFEIKIESKAAEFVLRQRTLPICQLLAPRVFDDANEIPPLENPFRIVENETTKLDVVITRGARERLESAKAR